MRMQFAQPPKDAGARLSQVPGVSSVEALDSATFDVTCDAMADRRAELAALAVNEGWGLLELHPLTLSLEEIFLQLTTEDVAGGDETLAEEEA